MAELRRKPPEVRTQCPACLRDVEISQIAKCFVCFRQCCEYCRLHRTGHDFCGKRCADAHFFGEEEIPEDLEDEEI
jgi:hypothetical protein